MQVSPRRCLTYCYHCRHSLEHSFVVGKGFFLKVEVAPVVRPLPEPWLIALLNLIKLTGIALSFCVNERPYRSDELAVIMLGALPQRDFRTALVFDAGELKWMEVTTYWRLSQILEDWLSLNLRSFRSSVGILPLLLLLFLRPPFRGRPRRTRPPQSAAAAAASALGLSVLWLRRRRLGRFADTSLRCRKPIWIGGRGGLELGKLLFLNCICFGSKSIGVSWQFMLLFSTDYRLSARFGSISWPKVVQNCP